MTGAMADDMKGAPGVGVPGHHTTHSSYRERLIEHLLLAELLRSLWRQGIVECEILRPQVDDAGYDLVTEAHRITRHIQLKSSFRGAATSSVKASLKLLTKPSACIVWIVFDPETLELGPYRVFGGAPGQPMPDIHAFRVAKHTRGPIGAKKERPNQRMVPRKSFEVVPDLASLTTWLFGDIYDGSRE
jgi:hypothetical protein